MTPRDLFGIIVRTAGLCVLLHVARNGFTALELGGAAGRWFWLHLIVALLVGVWLLGGARILVAYAYRKDSA
jgi:hypothetical protein